VELKKRKYIDEIKKSYLKFETLIHNILDIIVEINTDGSFTFISAQSFDLFGYHPEELIGLNAFDFVHPEDLFLIKQKMSEAFKSRKILSAEYKTKHKKGYYIPVSTRGGVYEDQGIIKFIGIIRNISEQQCLKEKLIEFRKKYEDLRKDLEVQLHEKQIDLKESEQKFRHLFETSPYSILLLNFIGKIIECNSATEKLFKYTKDELIGQNFLKLINLPSKSLSILEEAYKQLTYGKKIEPIEIQAFTKEGRLIWVRASGSLVRLYNEILIQIISQDITKEKILEKEKENSV